MHRTEPLAPAHALPTGLELLEASVFAPNSQPRNLIPVQHSPGPGNRLLPDALAELRAGSQQVQPPTCPVLARKDGEGSSDF